MMDMFDHEVVSNTSKLQVVKAAYQETITTDWKELFDGFDELFAITFSSGIKFVNKVIDKFEHAEIIFGCEGVMSGEVAAIMSMQINTIKSFVKTKAAKKMAERLDTGTLDLYVSRDTKSHEKIFVMRAKDGRTRVVTGSANMSASAFCGLQRENILCFDDSEAFDFYKSLFDAFKDQCSDRVTQKAIIGTMTDSEFLEDNIEEIPIIATVSKKKLVILEETSPEDDDTEIVVNVKGLENELKPMLPKQKNDGGKVMLSGEIVRGFKRKLKEHREEVKEKRRKLPKLHINYETGSIDFNGKDFIMNPTREAVSSDVKCLLNYLSSLNCFYGDVQQSQRDYFRFMNWYFASPFMPYLRYIASKNSYDVTPFPVVGIIYGDSNGGKSTFIRLLTKLMCGTKVPMNSSNDFTSTNIEYLKQGCEGLPINIDDLAKNQFTNHSEKVIKDDGWGIPEVFINYPAIAITTNKLASLPQDITKRTVTCHIDARIDKEAGAKNSKKINESMKQATTALFCEYARRMLAEIDIMEEQMKETEADYFPDVFAVSSRILVDIIRSMTDNLPDYISELSYSDYFGDKAVGRNAMQKIMTAWKNEPKQFKIDKKNNTLTYSYPEQGRLYELTYIQQELPPALNARLTAKSIVMDLDQAVQIFETSFRKRIFSR